MKNKGKQKNRGSAILIAAILLLITGQFLWAADLTATDYWNQAENQAGMGNFPEAIDYYREALLLNPRYFDALKGLASAYFFLEEYETALEFIKQAKVYGKNDLGLLTLEGRIHVGKGDLETAETILRQVLKKEPHNVDANLGLAEISLIKGDYDKAFRQFKEALTYAPESRRALLSLVVLHDSRFEWQKAEDYLKLAVRLYPDDILVYSACTRHYIESGLLDKALFYVSEMERLDPALPETVRLKGYILIMMNSYAEGIDLLNRSLRTRQDEPLTWYLLALAYQRTGQTATALRCYEKVLNLSPDDEIARLSLENLLLTDDTVDDETRLRYSRYHHEKGKKLEEKYLFDKAHDEYRRGILINGDYYPGWVLLANLFSKRGYPGKYLDKLLALRRSGAKSEQMDREIERAQRTTRKGVAENWRIDQFNIVRKKSKVMLFTMTSQTTLIHHSAEDLLTGYVSFIMEENPWIEGLKGSSGVRSFSEAFRAARDSGCDYFVILKYVETERTFGSMVELYLARTGALVVRFPVLRTGNGRIQDVLTIAGNQLVSALPPRSSLIRSEDNRVIIDRGRYHGSKPGDKYLIVRRGKYRLTHQKPYREIDEAEILGTLTIINTDEEISEGTMESTTRFNLVNPGDDCFLMMEEDAAGTDRAPALIDYELKGALLKIY
jgi:tetratricopeptide (TPR) repeat protein